MKKKWKNVILPEQKTFKKYIKKEYMQKKTKLEKATQ